MKEFRIKQVKVPTFLYYDNDTQTPSTSRGIGKDVHKYINVRTLWHSAEENPLAREEILIYNAEGDMRIATLTDRNVADWQSLVSFAHIVTWIYAEDIWRTSPYIPNDNEKIQNQESKDTDLRPLEQ